MMCLLLSIFLSTGSLVYGQFSDMFNFSIDNGLASNQVYYSFQDSRGFIWFATDKGVIRYDSYSFEHYTSSNGLSGNEVFQIHEDSRHRIWFLTHNGKISYWKEGKFYNAQNDSNLRHISSISYWKSFYEDENKNVWFGSSRNGIYRLDSLNHVWPYKEYRMLPVQGMKSSVSDGILLSNNEGVYRVKNDFIDTLFSFPSYNARSEFVKPTWSDAFLCSYSEKLMLFNTDSKKVVWERDLDESYIVHINPLKDSTAWIGTMKGAYLLSAKGKILDSFPAGFAISSILKDNEGNLWFSSLGHGVFVHYRNFMHNYGKNVGINQSYAVSPFGRKIAIGGRGVLNVISAKDQIVSYNLPSYDPKVLSNVRKVKKVVPGIKSDLWLATEDGIFHFENDRIQRLINGSSKSVYIEDAGTMVFSMTGVTLSYNWKQLLEDIKTGLVEMDPDFLENHSIFNDNGYACYREHNGDFLIAGENGLWRHSSTTGSAERLLKFKFIDVFGLPDGRVVLVSESMGIFEKNGNDIRRLLSPEKLNNVLLTAATLDDKHNLWLGSTMGIFKFDPLSRQIRVSHIQTKRGLGSNQINDICVVGDTIWLAHENGATTMPVNYEQFNDQDPMLYLNHFMINGKTEHKVLDELAYDMNHLGFSFQGISYKGQGDLTFKYTLKGKEEISYVSKSRELDFPALSPGNYELIVSAEDIYGNWSNELSYQFNINQPWWKSLWFYCLLIIAAIFITYLFFKYRILSYNREVINTILIQIARLLSGERYIVVKSIKNGESVKINLNDLYWIKASREYVEIKTTSENIVVRASMREMETLLKSKSEIIRLHRSYMINLTKADAINWDRIQIKGTVIPIGRTYRSNVNRHRVTIEKMAVH